MFGLLLKSLYLMYKIDLVGLFFFIDFMVYKAEIHDGDVTIFLEKEHLKVFELVAQVG